MPQQFQVFWALVVSLPGQSLEDLYHVCPWRADADQMSADTFFFECIVLLLLIYTTEKAFILILVSEKLFQVVCQDTLEFDF